LRIGFEPSTQITAATGQSWTASVYTAVVAGSVSNISAIENTIVERNSAGGFLGESVQAINATNALVRSSISRTFNDATAARTNSQIKISFSSGVAIDFTLRIGLPQLEQGAFATSVIPTSGTAVTRSADVASISGSNFSSWYRQDEGTVFYDGQILGSDPTTNKNLLGISNGTASNTIDLFIPSGLNQRFRMVNGGVSQALQNSIPTANVYSPTKVAYAFKLDDTTSAGNGTVLATDTSCTIPSVDRFTFGAFFTGEAQVAARLKRVTFWPQRLPNTTLQQITQ
jgi:hypothetical protein